MHTIQKVDPALGKKLAPLFAGHPFVDFGITSILEGQSGKQIMVVVDDLLNPNIALIRYGTFGVLGGDASHIAAGELMQSIDLPCAIQHIGMPLTTVLPGWQYGLVINERVRI